MKRTPWFDASVKPVRAGLYETYYVQESCNVGFRLWDGSVWWTLGPYPCEADFGNVHGDKWRGLAEPQK